MIGEAFIMAIEMMTEKDFWDKFNKKHNPSYYYASKKTKEKKTKSEPEDQEVPEEIIEEPKEKRNLFGKLLRLPGDVLYFVIGLIAGSILGVVSLFVFPFLIPGYMLKERFNE